MKNMMRLLLSAATLFSAQAAWALRAGNDAVELTGPFLANGPVSLTAPLPDAKKLRVLVPFRAGAAADEKLLPLLQDLGARYPEVTVVAVSADDRGAVEKLLRTFPAAKFAVNYDKDGKIVAKYMGSSALYPSAVVIDNGGRVLWFGEFADLGTMLEQWRNGTFNASKRVKIEPLLDELQSRMRSGEDRQADYAARKVLLLDPANTAALRMRIFMLEQTRRMTAAWNLAADQLRNAPKERALYLLQLDLASRHAQFADQLPGIVALYMKNLPPDADADAALAWSLLTRQAFDPVVLEQASALSRRAMGSLNGTLRDAEILNAAALLAARTGRLEEALSLQKRATAILAKYAPHRQSMSEALEKYYGKALTLSH